MQGSKIGSGTTIVGSISGSGDLAVDGRVEGSLSVSGEVELGDGALVRAPVSGRNVVVRGAVSGAITAEDAIVLETGARVVGDLTAPRVGIRPGGLLKGYVSTEGSRGARPAQRQRAEAPAAPPRARPAASAGAAKPPEMPAVGKASAKVSSSAPTRRKPAPPAASAARPGKKAPPPVVPALKKGAKGSVKRRGR